MQRLASLICLTCLFLCCGSKQLEVERIIEDGVEVVLNHIEPYEIKGEPLNLILEQEYIIDMELDAIGEIGLNSPENFVVDSLGCTYFQNNQRASEYHLYKFDNNGKYVGRFGKSGQGPGEIGMSLSLAINTNDEVFILDFVRKRLLRFSSEGALIEERPIDVDIVGIEPLSNENYLVSRLKVDEDDRRFVKSVCNSELEVIREVGSQAQPSGKEKWNAVRNIFMISVASESLYLLNAERGYEILELDLTGKLLKKIRKQHNSVPVTEEYKRQRMSGLTSEQQERYYFPEAFPPIQYIFSDEAGRLYVMTYQKSQDAKAYVYNVFNADGVFIRNISLGNIGKIGPNQIDTPLHVKSRAGNIYLLRTKDSGYLELVVYKMIWQ
ncbi:6-bladed beta-propeller [Acidobacteriota bacterium]